jgi:hypothetical protein
MFKTAFSENIMVRTKTFEWFSQFKCRESLIADHEHFRRPSTGHTDINIAWNMLANSDRELEHVVDLHKVCAVTAQ